MHYVLAVDGGNTKTIALVAGLDGRILGSGRAGCGDIYVSGPDQLESPHFALSNIKQAVTDALQMAQVEREALVTGVFGMAGADWPEDFALLQSKLEAHQFGRSIFVQNDALGVLHAGTTGNVGVSIVCGTGSATGARGPDGRVWHSSFWQLDAEGSVQLSYKALYAVYRSELEMELPTTLTARVLDYFRRSSVEELLHHMTARKQHTTPDQQVVGLTPILLDEAEAGDSVAQRIVQEHGHALAKVAVVAARRVGIEGTTFPLVLAGGVLRHPTTILVDAITEQIRKTSPQVQPVRSPFEPVVGLLFSALENAGVAINEDLLERLVPTIPDAALFETRPMR